MILKSQQPIEFNSSTQVIFNAEDLKKAILWYSDKPVCRLKHVYLHGKYFAVSIYEQKIHIHRLLMMYYLKRDLGRFEYVHHIDGNRFNNLKNNLEVLWASEHQSITNKGRKQSPSEIQKRIDAVCKTRYGHGYNPK